MEPISLAVILIVSLLEVKKRLANSAAQNQQLKDKANELGLNDGNQNNIDFAAAMATEIWDVDTYGKWLAKVTYTYPAGWTEGQWIIAEVKHKIDRFSPAPPARTAVYPPGWPYNEKTIAKAKEIYSALYAMWWNAFYPGPHLFDGDTVGWNQLNLVRLVTGQRVHLYRLKNDVVISDASQYAVNYAFYLCTFINLNDISPQYTDSKYGKDADTKFTKDMIHNLPKSIAQLKYGAFVDAVNGLRVSN